MCICFSCHPFLTSIRYFINELHIIIFDPHTSDVVSTTSATFNNPSLWLSPKYNTTFQYGYDNCHRMMITDGDHPYTRLYDFLRELKSCSNIYVRGSIKRRLLSRLVTGVNVHNITLLISDLLCKEPTNGDNLPGYVTYSHIRSIYSTDACCVFHKNIENGNRMYISNQCTITFMWFIDNYYWLLKKNINQ